MITKSEHLSTCLITGSPVQKILDLGQHAYADTFIAENQLDLSEPVFPLQLFMNSDSGSIQLGYVSKAEDRYNLYGYSYTSSNSQTSRNHWTEYATTIQEKYPSPKLAVEIGSNDGYLINQFKSTAKRVLGVDSSEEMCNLANANHIPTICNLFDETVADSIREEYGEADIIMANNVFNHANNPVGFARGVLKLLSANGVFVFEVPSWAEMVTSNRFVDMVYHEHISYFTVRSCWNLLQAAGLDIVDFNVVNYHGGSLRIEAKKSTGTGIMPKKVADAIQKEIELGLFDVNFYTTFQQKLERDRNAWLNKFYQILNDEPDAVIIGVGAAAKANTWLNWHRLDKTLLRCITDASQFKQGKYTPLTRIPIVDDSEFAKYDKPYALVLSWNIGDALKAALLKINPNVRFISQ
jgi:SAM-dependent methyltransferase